jgi:hypothetical protein
VRSNIELKAGRHVVLQLAYRQSGYAAIAYQ